ncbi:hypothetical protein WL86_02090 [Burkholderia diffusa]|nr:hypothetical protein WL86_02090 [Burkholderia diffusa]
MAILVFLHWQISQWRVRQGMWTDRRMPNDADGPLDPVTGNVVDPVVAPTVTFKGKAFFFESETTRTLFMEHPERYAVAKRGHE